MLRAAQVRLAMTGHALSLGLDLLAGLLRLRGGDRDAGLAGEFLVDLEPDQPAECLLGRLLLAQLHGALVARDGLVEVGDLGVQRRDRDPVITHDRG